MDEQRLLDEIEQAPSLRALEDIKVRLFGKNGVLSQALRHLSELSDEEKRTQGAHLNTLKKMLQEACNQRAHILQDQVWAERLKHDTLDVTLPSIPAPDGRFHPLTQTMADIIRIFSTMGFSLRYGPEVETPYYNFTALNVPDHHPARTMQDTFYLAPDRLLRTHTTPVQIRTLASEGIPLRVIVPGRVYRADYDQTHTPMFHQIDGFVVGEAVHMGHLKGCLEEFFRLFFGKALPCRFRPSFFPFTEPSAEVDIPCRRQEGRLEIGLGEEWLEVLGCGMIHPHILQQQGLEGVHGFAFGMGIERLAMLKYGIEDIRAFYQNDQRWLRHYGFDPCTL